MASENPKKENSLFFVLLLFIGAGALFLMYLKTPTAPKTAQQKDPHASEKFEKSVNKNLMLTNENIEMSRQRMIIENAQYAKDFNSTTAQKAVVPENRGVDLTTDTRAEEVANDLGRGERQADNPASPHEIIQGEMFNEQQNAAYTKAYKDEYARQFVENARQGGYKVILSDDYKVLSVTPLRKPSQSKDLFEGDSTRPALQ